MIKLPYFKKSVSFASLFITIIIYLQTVSINYLYAEDMLSIKKFIGENDSIVVKDNNWKTVLSKNADKMLIPASTLKILTSLVALKYLGKNFRFKTEFYMDKDSNLKIKGYGDPVLISENIEQIAENLNKKLKTINDIVLDDSYFDNDIKIPGLFEKSTEPYDAPVGALSANFNTINFRHKKDGLYESAEPQTPLLPYMLKRIENSSINEGRITLSIENNETTMYFGHLLRFFLGEKGVKTFGDIKIGEINFKEDKHIYTYVSNFSLPEIITKLMLYSNNFTANQLLITSGAALYGPPATLEKGIRAALSYADKDLGLKKIDMAEGSGLSRKNRISANMLIRILQEFKPYMNLMRHRKNEYFKTGTLKDINTRAGYIKSSKGEMYCYVLLINSPDKTAKIITDRLISELN